MNGLSMYSDEEISKRRTAMLKSLDDITIDYDKYFLSGFIRLEQYYLKYVIKR